MTGPGASADGTGGSRSRDGSPTPESTPPADPSASLGGALPGDPPLRGVRPARRVSRKLVLVVLGLYAVLVGVVVWPSAPRILDELNREVRVSSPARSLRQGVELATSRRWGAHAGQPHGPWKVWRSGHLTAGEYRAGLRDGVWTDFAPDGSVQRQRRFEHGKLVDARTQEPWWGDPGTDWIEYSDGVWTVFEADGTVVRQTRWLKGQVHETRTALPWWGDPARDWKHRPVTPLPSTE